MIKLTLEECKSFKFFPIQYELEEIRIRELINFCSKILFNKLR